MSIMKKTALLAAAVGLSTFMAVNSCTQVQYGISSSRVENSPQYQKDRFQNPTDWNEPGFGAMLGTMWDFLVKDNDRKPDYNLPVKTVDLAPFNSDSNNQLNATWLGHSSLMINIDGFRILTDPVFEKSITLAGPSRFNGELPMDPNEITNLDVVIISHDHYDHLNRYSIELLADKTDLFITPLGVGARMVKWGIPAEKIRELDWWEEYQVNDNLMLVSTPAQHFSGRGVNDRNKTLWSSWVIETGNHRIFFSGDSGYFGGFQQIGEKYGPFDMTFLECGAYDEKWHYVHMYPEETLQAHLDLKGKILHPIHWATFNLSLHSWNDPIIRLTKAAEVAGVQTATPLVGETTELGKSIPNVKWWKTTPESSNQQVSK
jgi:L-ascorbate metabolism protein UlaG (beta-lactamase superfamily)